MATVHVIGAGLAGLSCALRLAEGGAAVRLYEATGHAGGRCRSYYDQQLERWIDNGNHLVFSGNHAVAEHLRATGAAGSMIDPGRAAFPFLEAHAVAEVLVDPRNQAAGERHAEVLRRKTLVAQDAGQFVGFAKAGPYRPRDAFDD